MKSYSRTCIFWGRGSKKQAPRAQGPKISSPLGPREPWGALAGPPAGQPACRGVAWRALFKDLVRQGCFGSCISQADSPELGSVQAQLTLTPTAVGRPNRCEKRYFSLYFCDFLVFFLVFLWFWWFSFGFYSIFGPRGTPGYPGEPRGTLGNAFFKIRVLNHAFFKTRVF